MKEIFVERHRASTAFRGPSGVAIQAPALSGMHPLWGIEHGCRTVVIYSPVDLSCYWNQSERSPANPAVIKVDQGGTEHHRLRHRPRDAG